MNSPRRWNQLNQAIIDCQACARLRAYCADIGRRKRRAFASQSYWARPVPNFGDPAAHLLVVGLAPAAHGANRTGRMFTGDRSGEWLYRALYRAGFANQPEALGADDGLQLNNCAITAICHCAPPDNKPTLQEQGECRQHLLETLRLVPAHVYLALGRIAWDGLWRALSVQHGWNSRRPSFGHATEYELPDQRWLIGCYHPSQQNTFTGRLTEPMLDQVMQRVQMRLETAPPLKRRSPRS